jgi:hypothetical protein
VREAEAIGYRAAMALTIGRSLWFKRRVFVVLGVVVLVCAVLGAWLGVRVLRGGSEADAARAVADRFVGDLESGNYAGAYGLLSSDTRAAVTQPRFVRIIETQPRHVRSHTIDGVNSSRAHPRAYVAVFVRVTFTNGVVSPHDILVIPQGGHWRVRGVPFWGIS